MSSCSPGSDRRLRALLLWAVLGLGASPAVAQAPADTTTPPAAQDTSATAILLRAEEDSKVRLPGQPRIGTDRLLPPLSRIILTEDSIEFAGAQTIGDLLAEVAGIYLWRGSWLGRAELPNYQGRGATSVEWVIDGVPYYQLGPDSLAVDPSLLPIGFVQRIEIERVAGLLRVHLMLHDHDLLSPFTRLTVARGIYDQARYEALLQRRFHGGLGYSLGASFLVSPSFNQEFGEHRNSFGWLEFSHVPSLRSGVHLRYQTSRPDREPSFAEDVTPADTLARPIMGSRNDLELRYFSRQSESGLGRRFDLLAQRSTWSSAEPDSLTQSRWQLGAVLGHRAPTASYGASLWYGSRWTRLDARAQAGWFPTERLSVALEAAHQRHQDSRSSTWALARAGVTLPLGASLGGSWRVGSVVAAPSLPGDSAQSLSDRELSFRINQPLVELQASYSRLAGFQPVGFWQFTVVDSIPASGPTEWVTVGGRLSPKQWFSLSGWHSKPLGRAPEGMPPSHSMLSATIRSQFLRTFRSGIFDLKLEVRVERWGDGVLGRTGAGDPVELAAGTAVRGLIQMRFVGFVVFYDRYNLTDASVAYVPGLRLPRQGSVFGVRWAFLN